MDNKTYSIPATIPDAIAHYADFHFMSLEFAETTCRDILALNGYGPLVLDNNENASAIILEAATFEVGSLHEVNELLLYVDQVDFLPDPDTREVSICLDNPTKSTLTAGVYTRVNDRIIFTSGTGYTIFEQLAQCGLDLNNAKNMQTLQSILEKMFDSPSNGPRRLRFNPSGNFCN